jgi:hypothetical protein
MSPYINIELNFDNFSSYVIIGENLFKDFTNVDLVLFEKFIFKIIFILEILVIAFILILTF